MTVSTGAQHDLSFVSETTFGTTPASPTMRQLPNTGSTLALSKTTLQSNQIRSDRQIEFLRHGSKSPGGDISFELAHGNFDTILEAALFGEFTANVLKSGTTEKSLTVERRFTDINQYMQFTGAMVSQLQISMQPDAMVTATATMAGKDMSVSGTSLGAPTAADAKNPFTTYEGTISEGGSAIALVTGLDLTLENNLQPTQPLFTDTAPCIIAGRSNLTGTVTAFFQDATLLNKFINETPSSLSVVMQDPDGATLTFDIPNIKYTGGDAPVQNEQGIILSLPFQALRDATEETNLKITRSA